VALTQKQGRGANSSYETVSAASVSSVVLAAPGAGFANRVLSIVAMQRGGTSVRMIVNVSHSASAQDAVGVNLNIANVRRVAGQESNFQYSAPDGGGIKGGNNQQTTIGINGDVNDSTETVLYVEADRVRV